MFRRWLTTFGGQHELNPLHSIRRFAGRHLHDWSPVWHDARGRGMTLERAIVVLSLHQAWRRGAQVPMTDPKELGEAIAFAIDYLSRGEE